MQQSVINDETRGGGDDYLSESGRRVLVKQHRNQLRRLRFAPPVAQRARVYCDRLVRANGDGQAAIRANRKTASKLKVSHSANRQEEWKRNVRDPGARAFGGRRAVDDIAVRPAGKACHERRAPLAVRVVDCDEAIRACVLPHVSYQGGKIVRCVPRAKAICWDDGETHPVSGALPTWFRNPTMPAIAGQRCWQNLQRTVVQVVRRYYDDCDLRLPPVYTELAIAAPRTWGGEHKG